MIGTEIANYRIVEKLGEGGMGTVYKAIDTQLDRPVAIKALNPELSRNPTLVERFRTEARAQAQMHHTNLATLYTFLVQDGNAYMVMEFVDGDTFDQIVLRRGPLPAVEAVPLFHQALAGIAYAHRLGIVHRDIKPSNIMLNRDGIVKVMDFGLAKLLSNRGLTRTGVRLGTTYYMSPEQVLNKPVDIRSDVYSLGATFYEILTSHVPFNADSEFQILNDHVNTPPPAMSSRYPYVPSAVEDAVMKALAKNPDDRHQSVEEFSAALEVPGGATSAPTRADTGHIPLERNSARPSPSDAPTFVPVAPGFWTTPRKLAAVTLTAVAAFVVWLGLRFQAKPRTEVAPPPPNPPASSALPPQPGSPTALQPAAKETPPKTVTVEAGTEIMVRTGDAIDPKTGVPGQDLKATVDSPVIVDHREVIRAGDEVTLRLQPTASSGGSSAKPDLVLQLAAIKIGGRNYEVVSAAPFMIKGGFLKKKRVPANTLIKFVLRDTLIIQPL
jgi:serine/threonine-protein kinase